jgi:hypothetical protein
MMKRMLLLLLLLLVLSGCTTQYVYDDSLYYDQDTWDIEASVLNGRPITEDKGIYDKDEDGSIRHLYLTVQTGVNRELNKEYSFADLNNYTDSELLAGEEPFCNVIMSEGTESSSVGISLFGFGETDANGQITIKGNTEKIRLRSYQIRLYDRGGTWNDMKTINLVKNRNDLSRMKQKLGFDLLENLDDIGSLRTGFVRLFVQDTTADGPAAYRDLGIYTFIEQPNTAYLTAHGLDVNGSLYRAENFNFTRHPESLMERTDSEYDRANFEEVLNIRNAENHEKLLKMLDLLEDETVPIEELMGRYFNEDNLLTFAAVNILMSNYDAFAQEYLLYSPQNALTWYLMPSSFEDALYHKVGKDNQKIPVSFEGLGFLYNNLLYRRYLEAPGHLEKLLAKVEEVREVLTAEWIGQQTLTYRKSILKFLYSVPEIGLLPRAATYVEPYIASFPEIVEYNYQALLRNAKLPDAPTITRVEQSDAGATFNFVTNHSHRELLTKYHLEVSSSADFQVLLFASEPTTTGQIKVENLPKVTTFVRIVATDQNGKTQTSSNVVEDSRGDTYYGCIVMERRVGE